MEGICTALSLSSETKCTNRATNNNGLFCSYHAKQVQGLYNGYKRRNAELDALNASPPAFLAKANLRTETFTAIKDETSLDELLKYLFKKRNLLERVIKARRLHHGHFYADTSDFGHKSFLDKLVNDKNVVGAALERLARRTAEVLYANQKWFSWVKERREQEEETREKEVVKIKKEAQLFKKHMKQVEASLREKKRREDKKRQDVYLDQAHEERMRQMSTDESVHDDILQEWDPIEDALEGEHEDLIALMKRLLWLGDTSEAAENVPSTSDTEGPSGRPGTADDPMSTPAAGKENIDPKDTNEEAVKSSGKAKKRAKAKAKAKATATTTTPQELVKEGGTGNGSSEPKVEVNESSDEMRRRLLEGWKYEMMTGMYASCTIENPIAEPGVVPAMPTADVDDILGQVAEIRKLLFCRLLLSQASVLPVALRSQSIQEFLADPALTTNDLRDICLRIGQPQLQEIRDACADFARSDEEESDDDVDEEDEQTAHELALQRRAARDGMGFVRRRDSGRFRTQHEQEIDERSRRRREMTDGLGQGMTDFGTINDEGDFVNKKIRVRICGKTIWNYPSEKAMARGGWLQFSIIAKGARFEDAAALCRNWQEFWELVTLAIFNYFPSNSWSSYAFEKTQQQFLKLGIVPHLIFDEAQDRTSAQPLPRGRGALFKTEWKNLMGFYIKRNDSISRRFVQYLHMQRGTVCVLVRDMKTGRILEPEPPEDFKWLTRSGLVPPRSAVYDDEVQWKVHASIGEEMFRVMEGLKKTSIEPGFNDLYDVTVWDLMPGEPSAMLNNIVQDAMIKARRACKPLDLYEPMATILKTVYRNQKSGLARDIRGNETSIYDDLHNGDQKFMTVEAEPGAEWSEELPHGFFYSEADAAEDLVLFPEEAEGRTLTAITGPENALYRDLESRGYSLKRFILDLDSDEDSDDYEDPLNGDQRALTGPVKQLKIKGTNASNDSVAPRSGGAGALVPSSDSHNIVNACPNGGDDPDCTCGECGWSTDDSEDHVQRNISFDEKAVARVYAHDRALVRRLIDFIFEESARHSRSERHPEDDWITHGEREKAKHFKQAWHVADLDLDSQLRWKAMRDVVGEARKLIEAHRRLRTTYVACVHLHEHRRVIQDMWDAMAAMSLFFPHPTDENKTQELADLLKRKNVDKLQLNENETKAQMPAYRRLVNSNITLPKDVWKPVDSILSADDHAPHEWDMTIRPFVAKLFKAGLVEPVPVANPCGIAVLAAVKHDGSPDVVLDYRQIRSVWPKAHQRSHIRDPREIDLLELAGQWAKKHANSRFALLRVWSHSHFYPLMIAGDSKRACSFSDTLGRSWNWKFMPKDMPGSEWSIQKNVEDRLWGIPFAIIPMGTTGSLLRQIEQGQGHPRYLKFFRDRMEVKRDIVLVMGTNEQDLQRYATAANFALQSHPWRLEIDLWKSFVNVDLEFMETLDKKWLE